MRLAIIALALAAAVPAQAENIRIARLDTGMVSLSDNYCPSQYAHHTSREKLAVFVPASGGAPSYACYEKLSDTVYLRWVRLGSDADTLPREYASKNFN